MPAGFCGAQTPVRFNFEVRGDPLALMEAHIDAAERGVSAGIRRAGEGLKREWRGQVISAGLGQRLANTVRNRSFPERLQSIGAASLVYSRAPVVVDAHDRGALIRSKEGLWLAIPLGPVQKMRGPSGIGGQHRYRITPAGWEQKTGRRLRFVYRRGRPSLLVDDGNYERRTWQDPLSWKGSQRRGRRNVVIPIFLLVPQAKLRRKLDLDRASEDWGNRLPGLILANWRDVDGR